MFFPMFYHNHRNHFRTSQGLMIYISTATRAMAISNVKTTVKEPQQCGFLKLLLKLRSTAPQNKKITFLQKKNEADNTDTGNVNHMYQKAKQNIICLIFPVGVF